MWSRAQALGLKKHISVHKSLGLGFRGLGVKGLGNTALP